LRLLDQTIHSFGIPQVYIPFMSTKRVNYERPPLVNTQPQHVFGMRAAKRASVASLKEINSEPERDCKRPDWIQYLNLPIDRLISLIDRTEKEYRLPYARSFRHVQIRIRWCIFSFPNEKIETPSLLQYMKIDLLLRQSGLLSLQAYADILSYCIYVFLLDFSAWKLDDILSQKGRYFSLREIYFLLMKAHI